MKKNNIIISTMVLMLCILGISFSNLSAIGASVKNSKPSVKAVSAAQTPTAVKSQENNSYTLVKSLDLVANPGAYLNKRVKIVAKFDKFSSLGLDYTPALRSSDKYITFLIKRDDAQNNIPLSELKNFMKRDVAEKHIDLETDDVIEYSGLVFSNALGDVWLDVEDFKILSSKSNEKKNK